MANFVPTIAYPFSLALPAAITQPRDHLFAEPYREHTSGSESTPKIAFIITDMPLSLILGGSGEKLIASSLASILPKSSSGSRDLGGVDYLHAVWFIRNGLSGMRLVSFLERD